MAINRGPFNALIDDDGSGTTGTPWNKARIAGVLLDPIDAMFNPLLLPGVSPYIAANTVDGTDNQAVAIAGGGFPLATRGAYIQAAGNENPSHGSLGIQLGSHALSEFVLYRGDATIAMRDVRGSPGALTFGASSGGDINLARSDTATALSVSGANGLVTMNFGLALSPVGNVIRLNTADGADTTILYLTGGGALSNVRGSYIALSGNESATAPGGIQLAIGNVVGANLFVSRSDAATALSVRGSDGFVSMNASGVAIAYFNSTDPNGGYVSFQRNSAPNGYIGSAALLVGGLNSELAVRSDAGRLLLYGQTAVTVNPILQVTGTGQSTIAGSLAVTGPVTAGHVIVSAAAPYLLVNTSAGADTTAASISGCSTFDVTRAAYIQVGGNQWSFPGGVNVNLSTHASALFRLFGGSGVVWFHVWGVNGAAQFDSSTSQQLVLNSTDVQGGYCKWTRSGVAVGEVGTPAPYYGGYTGADFMVRAENILLLQSALSGGARIDAPPVYSNTTGNAANVNVDVNGTLRRFTSSVRYKRHIESLAADWGALLALRPVSFEHVATAGERRVGLLAEEVAAIDPRLAVCGADGQPEEVAYANMTAPLLAAIQDLHARLTALEQERDST